MLRFPFLIALLCANVDANPPLRLARALEATSRRCTMAAALASLGVPMIPADAAGLSQADVLLKLSRVPVFAITNKQSQPYLTEVDNAGRRSGFFYLGPRDALTALQQVREFDPSASLSVVSLDAIWEDLPKTSSEAAAALAEAAQPRAGTSTDLRLFSLKPLSEEADTAQEILRTQRKAIQGVSLFYEPSLLLSIEGGQQQPYFFRFADLSSTWSQAAIAPDLKPEVRIIDLVTLVNQLRRDVGSGPSALLVAASDAAEVVQRIGVNQGDGSSDGAVRTEEAPVDRLERLARTTPFGGGTMK